VHAKSFSPCMSTVSKINSVKLEDHISSPCWWKVQYSAGILRSSTLYAHICNLSSPFQALSQWGRATCDKRGLVEKDPTRHATGFFSSSPLTESLEPAIICLSSFVWGGVGCCKEDAVKRPLYFWPDLRIDPFTFAFTTNVLLWFELSRLAFVDWALFD